MNVFIYDNGNNRLEINEPEILLIKEFKALSDRDKTKNKDTNIFFIFLFLPMQMDYQLFLLCGFLQIQ